MHWLALKWVALWDWLDPEPANKMPDEYDF